MTHIHATAILNGTYRAGECFRDPLALRRAKGWLGGQIKQDATANGQRLDHEVAAKKINAWDGSSPAVDASVVVPIERKNDHYQYTLKNIDGPCVWL